MSDKDTIFVAPADQATTATAPVVDPNSPVALLVGEGRKYKTLEDLAKAYIHLDEHTLSVKEENAKFREQLAQASTLDDVLKQLKDTKPAPSDQSAAPVKGLGVEDVAAIVKQTVTGLETTARKQANLVAADNKMKELFGDKAAEVFVKEAATPQMREALISLASVSPDKFVALFTKDAPPGSSAGKTNVNTAAMQSISHSGRATDPTTKEYFSEIRKKDPKLFYSASVQLAMQKAAISNRDHFYGTKP